MVLVALKKERCSKAATTPTTPGQHSASDSYDAYGRPETTQLTAAFHPLWWENTVCILTGSTIILTGREVERGSRQLHWKKTPMINQIQQKQTEALTTLSSYSSASLELFLSQCVFGYVLYFKEKSCAPYGTAHCRGHAEQAIQRTVQQVWLPPFSGVFLYYLSRF